MDMREFLLPLPEGSSLACREYVPEGDALGAVQIIHGIAEHSGRYDPFARFLAENGWAVYCSDLPGHGPKALAEGTLGRFPEPDGWRRAAESQHALLLRAGEQWPGKPLFLFGHSMGSFLARTCLILWPGGLRGCVLSGTGHQAESLIRAGCAAAGLVVKLRGGGHVSETLRRMAFGSYNKRIPDAASPNAWLSRDAAVVEAYDADPLCGFTPSAGLLRDMMGGIRLITDPEQKKKMDRDLPVLFIAGEEDPVGEYGAGVFRARESFLRAGLEAVDLKLYPGDRHEVLNELDRETVYRDVLTWLKAQL